MQRLLKIFLLLLVFLLLIMAFFVYYSVDILLSFFPLENPEAVVFTMAHNTVGAQNIIFILLEPCARKAVENSLFALSLIGMISFAISLFYSKKKLLNLDLHKLLHVAFIPFVIGGLLFIVVVGGQAVYKIPIISYVKAYGFLVDVTPLHNPLYEKDYVYPDSVNIVFNEKKNLILIVLESMEYNFQNKENGGNLPQNRIPEITSLMKKHTSFEPGGITVAGTGWTMGETVAKFCGLPLKMPLDGNSFGIKNYLKSAVCLTDVLRQNGYNVKLFQGTDAHFASMVYFLRDHGVRTEDIFDLRFFKKRGMSVSDTTFFLSVKDDDLYEEVKIELLKKRNRSEPWAVWFYTIDTHGAYGRLDSGCVDVPNNLKMENQYPYVLNCASKQLANFLEWAEKQKWYENTTIAVMGDHPAMVARNVIGYSDEKMERYWLNFFVNSSVEKKIKNKRKFTSFDMFPTILEAMGVKIDGHALGLGRSLFSDEPTLIEIYGRDSLNSLIGMKSTVYDSFWKVK